MDTQIDRQSSRMGLRNRLAQSLPGPRLAITGAVLWGALMALSAFVGLWMLEWQTTAKIQALVVLYAAGGVVAFPLAYAFARFASLGRSREIAFASALLGLALATIGVTALIFALDYRIYYASWHANAFTITWIYQLVFTVLGAFYQFGVLGLRLYLPLGFVALVVAALLFARNAR